MRISFTPSFIGGLLIVLLAAGAWYVYGTDASLAELNEPGRDQNVALFSERICKDLSSPKPYPANTTPPIIDCACFYDALASAIGETDVQAFVEAAAPPRDDAKLIPFIEGLRLRHENLDDALKRADDMCWK
jgi:hypothetical protein